MNDKEDDILKSFDEMVAQVSECIERLHDRVERIEKWVMLKEGAANVEEIAVQ